MTASVMGQNLYFNVAVTDIVRSLVHAQILFACSDYSLAQSNHKHRSSSRIQLMFRRSLAHLTPLAVKSGLLLLSVGPCVVKALS